MFNKSTNLEKNLIETAISSLARKCLTLTMFFIGASLSASTLKAVGFRPLLMGILLWIIVSVASLAYILFI